MRSYLISLLSLSLVQGIACASSYAEETPELRPTWSQGSYQLPQNASILYSSQDPSFMGEGDFGTRILGQKRISELKDDYLNRNRDYEMRQSYGIATQVDEINHEQSMKDMGRNVLNAARNGGTQGYAQNAEQAEKNGQVAQPLVYVGAAASVGMGAPIHVKITDDTKATWVGDARARHGQIDVKNPNVTAQVQMDASPGAAEKYQVAVNKPLILSFNSSVVYGGSSNTVNAALSRPIVDRLSGTVSTSVPAGNSPTGAVPQQTVGLSYGMTF